MKQEDKNLLLRYLSMALPYRIKVLHEGWNYEWDDTLCTTERIVGIDEEFIYTKVIDRANGEEYREANHSIDIFDDKPYLRPMSSMTEEEEKEYNILCNYNNNEQNAIILLDWLLKKHFDFMGLIEKGLAIEVTEEYNPYNITEE